MCIEVSASRIGNGQWEIWGVGLNGRSVSVCKGQRNESLSTKKKLEIKYFSSKNLMEKMVRGCLADSGHSISRFPSSYVGH